MCGLHLRATRGHTAIGVAMVQCCWSRKWPPTVDNGRNTIGVVPTFLERFLEPLVLGWEQGVGRESGVDLDQISFKQRQIEDGTFDGGGENDKRAKATLRTIGLQLRG